MTEAEELREATREAHAAMKDLRFLMRDCRVLLAEMQDAAQIAVNEQVQAAIVMNLESHQRAIKEAILEAEQTVYARFAEIGDVLLGEDRNHKKAGRTIKQIAMDWAAENSTA